MIIIYYIFVINRRRAAAILYIHIRRISYQNDSRRRRRPSAATGNSFLRFFRFNKSNCGADDVYRSRGTCTYTIFILLLRTFMYGLSARSDQQIRIDIARDIIHIISLAVDTRRGHRLPYYNINI